MSLSRAVLAGFAALTFLSCGGGNAIKIGLVVPLTGDVKTFGESARNGTMIAIDEVNAAGGINGKKIQAIATDD
jgi:branched-chain amino acid transport system substrate-binding protein